MTLLIDGFSRMLESGGWMFLLLGVVAGIIIGSLPGLTGTMGMTLLLPFTYSLSADVGISLLIGIFAGAIYGGSISAILLRTPVRLPRAPRSLTDTRWPKKVRRAGRWPHPRLHRPWAD